MSKINIFTLQSLEFLSLNVLLKLKNHFSYKHYLKKQNITRENLEIRLKNSIEKLTDIRVEESSSTEKWDKIKDCEYGLHKILQSDVNLTNKNLVEKIKISKSSFNSFSKLKDSLSTVEISLQELNSKSEIDYKEIGALEEYINCLYINLNREEKNTILKNFEKNYSGTVIVKNYRKNRIKKSDKDERNTYFNSVLNKLVGNPPSYNLDGSIIDRNYKIKNKDNRIKYKRGPINIDCSYVGQVLDSDNLKVSKSPNILCYVADEISTPSKNFVGNFTRSDKLLFSYSICEEKLYKSPHINSDIYSRYFDPKKRTLSIKDINSGSFKEVVKNV